MIFLLFSKNLWKTFNQDSDGIYLLPAFKDPFKFYGCCFIRSGSLKGQVVEFTLTVDDRNSVTWGAYSTELDPLKPSETTLSDSLKSIKTFLNTQRTTINKQRPQIFSELLIESNYFAVTKNSKSI